MKRHFSQAALRTAVRVRHAEQRLVRFQDVDAAETIFFPRVLEYMSDTYVSFLFARGLDIPAALRARAYAAPIVHAEADYLRPMRFGDLVGCSPAMHKIYEAVEMVATAVSARSYAIGYRIRDATGVPTATGETLHVCVDGASFTPRRLPDELRDALSDAGEVGD